MQPGSCHRPRVDRAWSSASVMATAYAAACPPVESLRVAHAGRLVDRNDRTIRTWCASVPGFPEEVERQRARNEQVSPSSILEELLHSSSETIRLRAATALLRNPVNPCDTSCACLRPAGIALVPKAVGVGQTVSACGAASLIRVSSQCIWVTVSWWLAFAEARRSWSRSA